MIAVVVRQMRMRRQRAVLVPLGMWGGGGSEPRIRHRDSQYPWGGTVCSLSLTHTHMLLIAVPPLASGSSHERGNDLDGERRKLGWREQE